LTPRLREAHSGDGFDHVHFWRCSLFAAAAAKVLAEQVGVVHQEEAFLGGLLQNLGMLALHEVLGESYSDLLNKAHEKNQSVTDVERRLLQIDHAELGAALAESWHLPSLLVAPI